MIDKKNLWMAILLMSGMLLTGIFVLGTETRLYREKEGSRVTMHHFTIDVTEDGFNIHLKSETPEGDVFQAYRLDRNQDTVYWHYNRPADNTTVTAERKGNVITMKGTDRGDPVEKEFKIDRLQWNQTFNIGLETFAGSKKEKTYFWAIGIGGPGNMKITKFKAKRKEVENVYIEKLNKKIEAVHVTISLTGLLSMFWTGHYWYRESDGAFLRYRGKNKPGGPVAVMELIRKTSE